MEESFKYLGDTFNYKGDNAALCKQKVVWGGGGVYVPLLLSGFRNVPLFPCKKNITFPGILFCPILYPECTIYDTEYTIFAT